MGAEKHPRRAGRLGDQALASDNCTRGPAVSASPNVLINNRRALRVADSGAYGGEQREWIAIGGAAAVAINNLPAHRMHDEVRAGGDAGRLVTASPDVCICDQPTKGA